MPRRIPLPMPCCIRPIGRRVVRRRAVQHRKLNCRVSFSIGTLCCADRLVITFGTLLSCRNILVRNRPFEDLQRDQGLIEGNFMPSVVDPDEAEGACLFDLPVYDLVTSSDVDVPGAGKTGGVDFIGNDLTAEPVAVVVRVAGVHHDCDTLLKKFAHILDCVFFSSIVACREESVADGACILRKVLVGTDGGLDFWTIEVLDVEEVWEWVGLEFTNVVLISIEDDVVDRFNLVGAEQVASGANFVDAGGFAVIELIDAITRTIEIVIQLCRDRRIIRRIIIGITRKDLQ